MQSLLGRGGSGMRFLEAKVEIVFYRFFRNFIRDLDSSSDNECSIEVYEQKILKKYPFKGIYEWIFFWRKRRGPVRFLNRCEYCRKSFNH